MTQTLITRPENQGMKKATTELIHIFNDHIGASNAITKKILFKKLFKTEYNKSDLGHYMMWELVKKTMHFLRLKSNCFIASNYNNGYEYYVIKTTNEAKKYIQTLENNINQIKKMQRRASQAVIEGWYKQQFKVETKKQLR